MRLIRILLPVLGLLALAAGLFLGLVPEVDDVTLDDGTGTITCDPAWRGQPDSTYAEYPECDDARSERSLVAVVLTGVGLTLLLASVVATVVGDLRRARWNRHEREALLQRLDAAVARAEAAASRVDPGPAPAHDPSLVRPAPFPPGLPR